LFWTPSKILTSGRACRGECRTWPCIYLTTSFTLSIVWWITQRLRNPPA
jgi:hypothetical protein